MHIVFLNGSEFRGSLQDFLRALWHPLFIALVLAMTGIIVLLRPYDHFMPDDVMARTLIIASSVVMYIATSVLMIAQSRRWRLMTLTFPVLIAAVFVASFWGVTLSAAIGGQALGPMAWTQLLAFNIILSTVGEIFLATFLLERIALETGMKAQPIIAFAPEAVVGQPPNAPPPEPPQIINPVPQVWAEVLGQRLAIADIWHLKAEEHYVSVNLQNGRSLLLRGRLADAIEQLPQSAGMQVHRSHWVATAAFAELWRAREGWRLRLQTGQEVPVARNRTAAVRQWAETMSRAD